MTTKHAGVCPFCKETITPTVLEENTIRRDKCQCPECSNIIYVCRTPGCDDYAKGGDTYDDELCPGCTRALSEHSGDVVKGVALAAAVIVVGGLAGGKANDSTME